MVDPLANERQAARRFLEARRGEFSTSMALDRFFIRKAEELAAAQPRCDYTINELPTLSSAFSTDIVPIFHNGSTYGVPVSGLPVISSIAGNADLSSLGVYNVQKYGAIGDGVTDSTSKIQAAINAASAGGGGIVYFPSGTYICNGAHPADAQGGLWLRGAGVASTFIMGSNGSVGSVIGITRDSMISDMTIDGGGVVSTVCSNGNNTGGQVDFLIFKNLRVRNGGSGNGWLFFVNGNATNPIQQVTIENLMLEGPSSTVQDAMSIGNQQHGIRNCSIRGLYINGVYRSPNIYAVDNLEAVGIYVYNVTNVNSLVVDLPVGRAVLSNVVIDGGSQQMAVNCPDTAIHASALDCGIKLGQNTSITGMTRFVSTGTRFGFTFQRYGATTNNPDVNLVGCTFIPTGSADAIADFAGGTWSGWQILGCKFVNGGTTGKFINNPSGSSLTNSVISNSTIVSGSNSISGAGTGLVIRNVGGLNPAGKQTPPAVPSSGASLINPFVFDCTVFIAGGTVTGVSIGGNATGLTSGTFRVPAGQSITLTYSVAPTWSWFGD